MLIGAASGFPQINRRNAIDEKSEEDMKVEAFFLEADKDQDGIATAAEVKAGELAAQVYRGLLYSAHTSLRRTQAGPGRTV